ncbi:hypothetical protein [Phenylobacterium sp.]|uniref:hypothetical protein n=1 Tax=Phenylobacterium sp. TaxID=1871053 RepID=UPI003BAC9D72
MTTPAAFDRLTPTPETTAAWTALASEGMGAWTCAWDAWAAYLGRLAVATGPMDVFDAGAKLSLESMEICSRVAATRLGGLRTPLLSDS